MHHLKLKLNLTHPLKSEPDSNPNHNPVLPVHLTEHITLTVGLFPPSPGMTPHHHHRCHSHFSVTLKPNLIPAHTSETDPNSSCKSTHLPDTMYRTPNSDPTLTPHHHHQRPLCLTVNVNLSLALTPTSEPIPNSNHNPLLPVHLSKHKP